jgi:hypothetical protein
MTMLEQAKEYIASEFLDGWPNGSFAELERKLKDKGFYKPLEPNPEKPGTKGHLLIASKKYPNLVLWSTENEILADAFTELEEEKKLKTSPTGHMIYFMDGCSLTYPIPKSLKEIEKNPDKIYWTPVVINTPERHNQQELQNKRRKRDLTEYRKIIANKQLVERHVCSAGIGYYLKQVPEVTQRMRYLFEWIDGQYTTKHSANCEVPNKKEVEIAKQFLNENCIKSDTINKEVGSSYSWKHLAEKWGQKNIGYDHGYVSNGSFITAALELRYEMEEDPQPSLNAHLKIDQISKNEDKPDETY